MSFLTLDVFLIIFIGMGPVKVLLLYIAATKEASAELQRKVALKTIATATTVGIVLLVAGVVFMRLLHFSRGALTVAGGLILLILALNIVLSPAQKEDHEAAPDEATLMSMAVYPLGIPMLLNPIGIVALTVFSAEAQKVIDLAVILGMLLVVAVIDLGVFLVSHRLDNWLTHERVLVMEKVLGIMLAALAVQLILAGLADVGVLTLSGGH
ncbi:MAG TPA: MarC family protein [Anaerolineae bacterium]|nr:MarC family protein [Anaerolineae bacterium]